MKRILSLFLACMLMLQTVPSFVFAADSDIATASITEGNGYYDYYIESFADLKKLAAKTYNEEVLVSFKGGTKLTISENLTIPDNLSLYFEDITVTVPSGVTFHAGKHAFINKLVIQGTAHFRHLQVHHTLKVTGKLYVGSLELEYEAANLSRAFSDVIVGEKNITFTDNFITFRPRITTTAELKTCIEKAKALTNPDYKYMVILCDDFVLDSSVTTPANCHITSFSAKSVTIAKGCTLKLNGGYYAYAPLTVKGTLVNNLELCIGPMYYQGGSVTIASGGSYSGKGSIWVNGTTDYKKYISGINLDHYTVEDYADGVMLRYTAGLVTAKTSNVTSSGKPKISWQAAEGAAKYQVYRATSKSGSYTKIATTSNTSYTDADAVAGTKYYYKVRSVTASGTTQPFSDVVSCYCKLPQPTVTAAASATSGRVKLTWGKVSGASQYAVYRSTTQSGGFEVIDNTTDVSYVDASAKTGTKYYYKVKALHAKESYNSVASSAASATRRLATPVATAGNDPASGTVTISWKAVSGASKYAIYRSVTKSGGYDQITTVSGTSFTDSTAPVGKTYYYKVKALYSNESGNSVASSAVSGTRKNVSNGTYYVSSFEELKALAAGTFTQRSYVYFQGGDKLVISEDFTQPKNLVFDFSDISITIPSGVTFNSYDSFFVNKLIVNGTAHLGHTKIYNTLKVTGKVYGSASIELEDDAASLDRAFSDVIIGAENISGCEFIFRPDIKTTAELKICVEKAKTLQNSNCRYMVFLDDDFVIDQSVTLPTNCAISTLGATSVTIATGCKLTVNSSFSAFSPTIVKGTLVNNSIIYVYPTNYESGSLTIASGGSYSGEGSFCIYDSTDYKSCISGINLNNYEASTMSYGVTLTYAPLQITAKIANNSSGKPVISWGAVNGASKYQIYRATSSSGTYTLLATTAKTTYTDQDATAGFRYYYKVSAVKADGVEILSSSAVNTYCKLATPTVKAAASSISGRVKLTWAKVSGASQYAVYRSTTQSGGFEVIANTTDVSYVDASAKVGVKYYYKVKALHSTSSANSTASSAVSATRKLGTPVVSITLSSGDPKLSWSKISGATRYVVYRATSSDGEYEKFKTVTSTTFTDTSAQAGTTYYYKVKASNGSSAATSAASTAKYIKAK